MSLMKVIIFKFVAFWGLVTRRITVIKSAASVPGWNVYHLGCHDPAWSSGCFRNILFPTFDVFQSFLIIRLHRKHRYVTSSSENRSSFNSNNSLVYWRISSKQKSLSSPVNGLQKWFGVDSIWWSGGPEIAAESPVITKMSCVTFAQFLLICDRAFHPIKKHSKAKL